MRTRWPCEKCEKNPFGSGYTVDMLTRWLNMIYDDFQAILHNITVHKTHSLRLFLGSFFPTPRPYHAPPKKPKATHPIPWKHDSTQKCIRPDSRYKYRRRNSCIALRSLNNANENLTAQRSYKNHSPTKLKATQKKKSFGFPVNSI